jgi:hypothetical protein
MRLGGIGTRYAVWIATLAFTLVSTALVAAGFLAFGELRVVQSEIHAPWRPPEPPTRRKA